MDSRNLESVIHLLALQKNVVDEQIQEECIYACINIPIIMKKRISII